MAWITERERDFLVRWRDAETGKTKSRSIRWNTAGPRTGDDFEFTKADARRDAEELAERMRKTERAFRKPLERIIRQNREDYPDWNPSLVDFIGQGEEDQRLQN